VQIADEVHGRAAGMIGLHRRRLALLSHCGSTVIAPARLAHRC
jgi:hypothetical protein